MQEIARGPIASSLKKFAVYHTPSTRSFIEMAEEAYQPLQEIAARNVLTSGPALMPECINAHLQEYCPDRIHIPVPELFYGRP